MFAGVSILVAIYVFRRNIEREYFFKIREKLIRYRLLVDEANNIFDEIGLVEISRCITNNLRQICPEDYSTNNIQEFFYDDENRDFVLQAIYLGLGESKTLKQAKEIEQKISQLASEFNEPFPLSRISLGILSAYNQSIVNTVSSGKLIDSIFEVVRNKSSEFKEQPQELLLHPDLVFRQMGIYITLLHIDFINSYADIMLTQFEKISGIITTNYESKSDRQLRKLSNLEKKNVTHYLSLGNSTSSSENALFEYLKFYKGIIKISDWESLIEAKTLLASVHGGKIKASSYKQ